MSFIGAAVGVGIGVAVIDSVAHCRNCGYSHKNRKMVERHVRKVHHRKPSRY